MTYSVAEFEKHRSVGRIKQCPGEIGSIVIRSVNWFHIVRRVLVSDTSL